MLDLDVLAAPLPSTLQRGFVAHGVPSADANGIAAEPFALEEAA